MKSFLRGLFLKLACVLSHTTHHLMRQDTVPTRENVKEIFDEVGFLPLDIHLSYPKHKQQILTLILVLTVTSPLPSQPANVTPTLCFRRWTKTAARQSTRRSSSRWSWCSRKTSLSGQRLSPPEHRVCFRASPMFYGRRQSEAKYTHTHIPARSCQPHTRARTHAQRHRAVADPVRAGPGASDGAPARVSGWRG